MKYLIYSIDFIILIELHKNMWYLFDFIDSIIGDRESVNKKLSVTDDRRGVKLTISWSSVMVVEIILF